MLNAEMQNAECRVQISDCRFIRAIPICILKSAVVVSSDAWVPARRCTGFPEDKRGHPVTRKCKKTAHSCQNRPYTARWFSLRIRRLGCVFVPETTHDKTHAGKPGYPGDDVRRDGPERPGPDEAGACQAVRTCSQAGDGGRAQGVDAACRAAAGRLEG